MPQDLDEIKREMEHSLEADRFVIFRGHSRAMEHVVRWDSGHHPDFHLFLETARRNDVNMIVFNHAEFAEGEIDDAFERLEECEIPAETRRRIEGRLKELRIYTGFVAALELSYDYRGCTYLYDQQSEWYQEFLDISADIDAFLDDTEPGGDDGPVGGYFSRN